MMKWKCATTKYVSCQCMSSACVATATPVMPPKTNRNRKAKKYSSGVPKRMFPRYRVAVQVNTLMAEKMATNIDRIPNTPAWYVDMPATNMWWPQVRNPTNAIPSVETAMAMYEDGRRCANV